MKVTMDSGAADPVCNSETFPDTEVLLSPGSMAGLTSIGPGSQRIPIEGQVKPKVLLEDSGTEPFTFQDARVCKPLMAVSCVNDKRHLVNKKPNTFNNPGATETEKVLVTHDT